MRLPVVVRFLCGHPTAEDVGVRDVRRVPVPSPELREEVLHLTLRTRTAGVPEEARALHDVLHPCGTAKGAHARFGQPKGPLCRRNRRIPVPHPSEVP